MRCLPRLFLQHRIKLYKSIGELDRLNKDLSENGETPGFVGDRRDTCSNMGCTASSVAIASGKEMEYYLNINEVEIIRKTWQYASKDMEALGLSIFAKLFENQKEIKRLFSNLMVPDEGSTNQYENQILDSAKLKRHAVIVMEGLAATVESLDDSVLLTNVLIAMGEKHFSYKVKPEMLPLLWPAIRDAMVETLGDKMTPEAAAAWEKAYTYIASKMTEGIAKASENS